LIVAIKPADQAFAVPDVNRGNLSDTMRGRSQKPTFAWTNVGIEGIRPKGIRNIPIHLFALPLLRQGSCSHCVSIRRR
jgi:hypothetical protein